MVCDAMSAFVIESSPPQPQRYESKLHTSRIWSLNERGRLTGFGILSEVALKPRMYSGYATRVTEFHVRLRGLDISGGMVRGGRELLLTVIFGLLFNEHRTFCF